MGRVRRVLHGMISLVLLCSPAHGADITTSVVSALEKQDAWLASSPQGKGWNDFLLTDALRGELEKRQAHVDRRTIAQVLGRYNSGTPGLSHRIFNATRNALSNWANVVKVPDGGTLVGTATLICGYDTANQ